MNETEQGVLAQSKLMHLLVHLLLLSALLLTHEVFAQPQAESNPTHDRAVQKHHAYIIYSLDNKLHSNIVRQLSDNIRKKRPDIIVSQITPKEKTTISDPATDIIIGIGRAGMQSAVENYPRTKKLFITTDPNKYRLKTGRGNAMLYMTQPYCRQINFIRLLNSHWRTISILSSEKKPVSTKPVQQCANKYDFKIYTVNTTVEDNLTNKIKQALRNSDVLLALPDSSIYNSRTVKNILLTSYRYRRPVIAFSKNFVNAGALASIHSDTRQIANSASNIIEQYFDAGSHFKTTINYPEHFDININRQVFRALDIPLPAIETLNKTLKSTAEGNAESAP